MITCLRYPIPGDDPGRVLLVMLPGAGIEAAEFAANGMVAQVHDRGWPVDIVAARPALELYLDGRFAEALHEAVVAPALAAGYRRVWLLGISMGGLGALLYAAAYRQAVAGLILLAPFLGTKGTVAEMAEAGGLARWSAAGSNAVEIERHALLWLQDRLAGPATSPRIFLGYGRADRFAEGHRMLAQAMPADAVITAGGGHDWPTWARLWASVLDRMSCTKMPVTLDDGRRG